MSKATEIQQTAKKKEQEVEPETRSSGLRPFRRGYPQALGPFSFMRHFSEEMDRLFEDAGFWRGFTWNHESGAGWTPRVETFERAGKFVVRAELPGVSKDDVNVEAEDDTLTIQGERRNQHEEKGEGFYRSECSYGHFRRSIPLPEGVMADSATAKFQDGILEIEMTSPERRQAASRRIEIQEGLRNS